MTCEQEQGSLLKVNELAVKILRKAIWRLEGVTAFQWCQGSLAVDASGNPVDCYDSEAVKWSLSGSVTWATLKLEEEENINGAELHQARIRTSNVLTAAVLEKPLSEVPHKPMPAAVLQNPFASKVKDFSMIGHPSSYILHDFNGVESRTAYDVLRTMRRTLAFLLYAPVKGNRWEVWLGKKNFSASLRTRQEARTHLTCTLLNGNVVDTWNPPEWWVKLTTGKEKDM